MIHLSKALPKMTALNELWLQDNQIGKKGLVSITNAVKNGIALKELWLHNNSFSLNNNNETKELEKKHGKSKVKKWEGVAFIA